MQNILFLLAGTGELCIVDDLACQKIRDWFNSPYIQARIAFWEDQCDLFPAYSPHALPFYWQHGPILELPERAASLEEWSHCIWCGCPLNNPVWDNTSGEFFHDFEARI